MHRSGARTKTPHAVKPGIDSAIPTSFGSSLSGVGAHWLQHFTRLPPPLTNRVSLSLVGSPRLRRPSGARITLLRATGSVNGTPRYRPLPGGTPWGSNRLRPK
jgi:hypothetical protein